MATNNLTPEMDLRTRDFFVAIISDKTILGGTPATRRALLSSLLMMLNYDQMPNGAFVEKGKARQVPYGTQGDYKDEWQADEERAIEAINNKDSSEASASEQAESTEVREGILPEDV